jgi:hypothetical protein
MIREREDVEAVGAILEKKTEGKVCPAFKGPRAEFSDADPAVDMGLAKVLPELMQREQTLRPLTPAERLQPLKYGGVD